jgi:cytochrome c553
VHLADWSDGDIVRAIREGIHPSGRSLLIMPSRVLRNLSDEDVQAIVAYLRYLPPEGEETPPNRLNTLGAIMVLKASIFEAQPPVTEPVLSPPAGPTAAYGAYLSSFTCEICHGADLLGDPKFQGPPLVAIPIAWSDEDFIDFMRTGIRPDGSSVDEEAMPWKDLSRMFSDDEELLAIYAFLQKKGGEFANR